MEKGGWGSGPKEGNVRKALLNREEGKELGTWKRGSIRISYGKRIDR